MTAVTVFARLDRSGSRVLCGRPANGQLTCRGTFGSVNGHHFTFDPGWVGADDWADWAGDTPDRPWRLTHRAVQRRAAGRSPLLRRGERLPGGRAVIGHTALLHVRDENGDEFPPVTAVCPVCNTVEVFDEGRLLRLIPDRPRT